jgi:hypothetical protein
MKHNLTNLTLIAVLLLTGFGCKNAELPFGGGGLSESTDPKEAIQTAFRKFIDQKSYHSVAKTKNAQGTSETEVDFNAPDRYRIKNNVANYKSEVIAIGPDSYSRTGEGKWTKMPPENALPVAGMRGKMTDDYFAAMRDFEAAGKENLNGRETFVYQFKSSYGGEATSKIWIAADTGLPVKVDSEGNYSGTPVQTSTVYEYDRETRIEAPKVN